MPRATLNIYIVGLALSLLLTLTAFGIIEVHFWSHHAIFSHAFLYAAIVVLALIQFAVQVYCFLHLGRGADRDWNITAFSFALIVVVILVGGTLWIMSNLQSNMSYPFDGGLITPQSEQG